MKGNKPRTVVTTMYRLRRFLGSVSKLVLGSEDLPCVDRDEAVVRNLDDDGRLLWITDAKDGPVRPQEARGVLGLGEGSVAAGDVRGAYARSESADIRHVAGFVLG